MTLAELEVIRNLMDMAADKGIVLVKVKLGDDCVEFAPSPPSEPAEPLRQVELPQPHAWQTPAATPRPQGITHPSLWTGGQLPSFPLPPKD